MLTRYFCLSVFLRLNLGYTLGCSLIILPQFSLFEINKNMTFHEAVNDDLINAAIP